MPVTGMCICQTLAPLEHDAFAVFRIAGKYAAFLELRAALLQYFPLFHQNKYLRAEPVYVRLQIPFGVPLPRCIPAHFAGMSFQRLFIPHFA